MNQEKIGKFILELRKEKNMTQQELSDKIDTVTYQKFHQNYLKYQNYDIYIFDEAHHISAPYWSRSIKNLIDSNKNSLFIGLTAESKRYYDNKDVAEEFFEGSIVYGYNQYEAVKNNILPKAQYVCAIFDTKGIENKYSDDSISFELKGRLSYCLKNCLSIDRIIKKHMPKGIRKGIVFVDSIDSIKTGSDLIRSIYPNQKIFINHSKLSKKESQEVMRDFKKSKNGFIIVVDMLNEGLHINGVNTIIMLRKTASPMIYIQQTGRGLNPGSNNVVIFDLVGNSVSLNYIESRKESICSYKDHDSEECIESNNIKTVSEQSIIYDYATPILSVLKDIDDIINQKYGKYEEWELDYIIDRLEEDGPEAVANHLRRGITGVIAMGRRLGIKVIRPKNYDSNPVWKKDKIDILLEVYPIYGADMVAKLTGFPRSSVIAKASKFGLKSPRSWTKEKEKWLAENLIELGTKECARILGRSEGAINSKSQKMGVFVSSTTKDKTKYREEFIKENVNKLGYIECAKILGVHKSYVYNITKRLGIEYTFNPNKYWSDSDIKKLIELARAGLSDKEIADKLNRTELAIRSTRRKYLYTIFPDKKPPKTYTKEDDSVIIEEVNRLGKIKGYKSAAKKLNRSVKSIEGRYSRICN